MKMNELLSREQNLAEGQQCILITTEARARSLVAHAITKYGVLNINQFMKKSDVYPVIHGHELVIKISETLIYMRGKATDGEQGESQNAENEKDEEEEDDEEDEEDDVDMQEM